MCVLHATLPCKQDTCVHAYVHTHPVHVCMQEAPAMLVLMLVLVVLFVAFLIGYAVYKYAVKVQHPGPHVWASR